MDEQGRVYVVEGRNDRVQVYDAEGRLLFVFGSTGAGSGEFFLPTAITLDSENRIYVADGFNRRVQMFRLRPQGISPQRRAVIAQAELHCVVGALGGHWRRRRLEAARYLPC